MMHAQYDRWLNNRHFMLVLDKLSLIDYDIDFDNDTWKLYFKYCKNCEHIAKE